MIVNVASVVHRSPFRYPGGKTWLVPKIQRWLRNRPIDFIEPFAGGGIIGLTVGFDRLAEHVTLVELDSQVAAVWHTILEDGEWLAERVGQFDCTREAVERLLAQSPGSEREQAFQTLVRNRVQRGGILAPGAGLVKRGENGRGVASRWYPVTLRKRILDIFEIRDRFTFLEQDGLAVVELFKDHSDIAFFVDPPYTVDGKRAGKRLYTHSDLDHEELFWLMSQVSGDFLMTYSSTPEVQRLAEKYDFETAPIRMKNTHHSIQTECLVGRDLGWLNAGDTANSFTQ